MTTRCLEVRKIARISVSTNCLSIPAVPPSPQESKLQLGLIWIIPGSYRAPWNPILMELLALLKVPSWAPSF